MEWAQILTIVGANIVLIGASWGVTISMFTWSRKESNDDRRQIISLINSIHDEMKDFHGRLCAIEERRK